MTEDNHKEYTAADFERYHSGQMPEAEMHALEKAALEDPFLADALEGYSYTKTPANDIAELRERLFGKKKRNQIFFLQNKVWLGIAASIILFAGIGYMVYELNSQKSFLARNEVKQIVEPKDSTFTTQNDTNKNNALASIPNVSELKNEKTLNKKNSHAEKRPVKKFQDDSSAIIAYNFSKSGNNNPKTKNETQAHEAEVIDAEEKAVVTETIKDSGKRIAAVTDSLSKFKPNTKDSLQMAAIAAAGYEAKQRKLARNADQSSMTDSAHQSLQEVIVTNGVNKKKNVEGLVTGKVAGISFNDPTYGPIGGWENFDHYLSDNISVPVNEKGERYKTKVVLSFEVDEEGDPKKVQIEQSQCNKCDQEAIRLLQSGPKWKYVSGKKYVIDVQF